MNWHSTLASYSKVTSGMVQLVLQNGRHNTQSTKQRMPFEVFMCCKFSSNDFKVQHEISNRVHDSHFCTTSEPIGSLYGQIFFQWLLTGHQMSKEQDSHFKLQTANWSHARTFLALYCFQTQKLPTAWRSLTDSTPLNQRSVSNSPNSRKRS